MSKLTDYMAAVGMASLPQPLLEALKDKEFDSARQLYFAVRHLSGGLGSEEKSLSTTFQSKLLAIASTETTPRSSTAGRIAVLLHEWATSPSNTAKAPAIKGALAPTPPTV